MGCFAGFGRCVGQTVGWCGKELCRQLQACLPTSQTGTGKHLPLFLPDKVRKQRNEWSLCVIQACVCFSMSVCVFLYACMKIYASVYMFASISVSVCVCVCMCLCVCMHFVCFYSSEGACLLKIAQVIQIVTM